MDEDVEYDELNLVDGFAVQLPGQEQVNIPQPPDSALVQLPFLDLSVSEELAWVEIQDPEDIDDIAAADAEMIPEEVPYSWEYWKHSENEFPIPDESGAPQVPSGWIDPVTMEEVP